MEYFAEGIYTIRRPVSAWFLSISSIPIGVADATEAPSTLLHIVLADHVHASIDTNTLTPSAQRLTPILNKKYHCIADQYLPSRSYNYFQT